MASESPNSEKCHQSTGIDQVQLQRNRRYDEIEMKRRYCIDKLIGISPFHRRFYKWTVTKINRIVENNISRLEECYMNLLTMNGDQNKLEDEQKDWYIMFMLEYCESVRGEQFTSSEEAEEYMVQHNDVLRELAREPWTLDDYDMGEIDYSKIIQF